MGQSWEEISKEEEHVGERIDGNVTLGDDVFHRGVVVGPEVKPIIFGRSYIDDINFGARNWDDLCESLKKLLESFRYWGISISLQKSAFGISVPILGNLY